MGRTRPISQPTQAAQVAQPVYRLEPFPFAQGVMPTLHVQLPPRRYKLEIQPIPMEKLITYCCPSNLYGRPMPVIGVATDGPNTGNKDFLPEIYQAAGLPFFCHSCLTPLVPRQIQHWTFLHFIGDHQPPTALYTLLRQPALLYAPTTPDGKLLRAARVIAAGLGSWLRLYCFTWNSMEYQTNCYPIAQRFSTTPVREVLYGDPHAGQFLYPHCERCSNIQGKLLS